jgi:hypothetical protein
MKNTKDNQNQSQNVNGRSGNDVIMFHDGRFIV